MKFLQREERILIKKDLNEIWSIKGVSALLIAVPFILLVLAPILYFVFIYLAPVQDVAGVQQLFLISQQSGHKLAERQGMFYVLTNVISPMLFLMVPLIISGLLAACCFAGERERGTIQSLLLTPISVKRILGAKLLCCIFLSLLVSAISFGVFAVIASVGDIVLKMPFFLDWNWLVVLLLLGPLLCVFGAIFVLAAAGCGKDCMGSFLVVFYALLPLIIMFLLQFTGLYFITAPVLLTLAVVVLLLNIVLGVVASRTYSLKKLMQ